MTGARTFAVEMDGRTAWIEQENGRITLLDAEGAVVFRDSIQVAAGSVQGLFAAVDVISSFRGAGEGEQEAS